jgi:hypothetical protein
MNDKDARDRSISLNLRRVYAHAPARLRKILRPALCVYMSYVIGNFDAVSFYRSVFHRPKVKGGTIRPAKV